MFMMLLDHGLHDFKLALNGRRVPSLTAECIQQPLGGLHNVLVKPI
jgi:hypothetical protein